MATDNLILLSWVRQQQAADVAYKLLPREDILVSYNKNMANAGAYEWAFGRYGIEFGPAMLDVPLAEFQACIAHECGHIYFNHRGYPESSWWNKRRTIRFCYYCEFAADEFAIMNGYGPGLFDYFVRACEHNDRYRGFATHPSMEDRLKRILELTP